MASYDSYGATSIAAGDWAEVTYFAPSGGQPAGVEVASLPAGTAVLSGGPIAQVGQSVSATLDGVQVQLASVCDVEGGAVFVNNAGSYFLFASHALQLGAQYSAASGFGLFGAAAPPACFVEGTRIETCRGAVPVEALRPGDLVRTVLADAPVPVVWIGRRRLAGPGLVAGGRGWPVRVLAGAFAPGVPARDLRLSRDHAVLVDGMLVPIGGLVNDATVAIEPVTRITYWHVELAAHDALLAEGMPAESYLDSGNRDAFDRVAGVGRQAATPGALAARPCAPVVSNPARHADIRWRLRARALALGFVETSDAGLSLATEAGESLPAYWDGVRAIAAWPPGAARLRLESGTGTPRWQMQGSRDDRRLGVAVRRIQVDGERLALDGPALGGGWHAPEAEFRWTGGSAEIVLAPSDQARRLEVVTAPMLAYWRRPETIGAAG